MGDCVLHTRSDIRPGGPPTASVVPAFVADAKEAQTGAFITPCPLEVCIVSRIERHTRRREGTACSIDRDHP